MKGSKCAGGYRYSRVVVDDALKSVSSGTKQVARLENRRSLPVSTALRSAATGYWKDNGEVAVRELKQVI
jgi:hypothetical protein